MNSQHIKSVNTDSRSKKRITFASSRKRSKLASADTFRTFHGRRVGLGTSAATREEQVHNPRPKKKRKQQSRETGTAEASDKRPEENDESNSDDEPTESNFACELDIALDRNASTIFASFHREVWHLVRSLPEILHHAEKVIDLLMAYILSPESDPESKSNTAASADLPTRTRFIVNHATTDLLHLLAVLARDLRHEMHPYLHDKIIPRIFNDLLHPPAPEDNKQQVPLDVSVVEAAFRTVSYVFRYDAEALLAEGSAGEEPCLEPLRQYYGLILASRRDVVRRLGAETFAPLVRKLSDSAKKRHLKRLLRALVRNSAGDSPAAKRLQADAVDGIATFLFEIARVVQGRLHSKGTIVVKAVVGVVSNLDAKVEGCSGDLLVAVGEAFMDRLRRALDSSNIASVFETIIATSKPLRDITNSKATAGGPGLIGTLRLVSRMSTCRGISRDIVHLLEKLLDPDNNKILSQKCQSAVLDLLSSVWKDVSNQKHFDGKMNIRIRLLFRTCIASSLGAVGCGTLADSHALSVAIDLMNCLSLEDAMETVGSALLSVAASLDSQDIDVTLALVHVVARTRDRAIDAGGHDSLFDLNTAKRCHVTATEREALLARLLHYVNDVDWMNDISKTGIAAQCLAFVANLNADDRCAASVFKSVTKSLVSVMTTVALQKVADVETNRKLLLTFSLTLESLACLLSSWLAIANKNKTVKTVAQDSMELVSKHLLGNPGGIWTLKSVSAFVQLLQGLDLRLDLDYNQALEILIPNLRSPSHFVRLHTLEILSSFPLRPWTVDHAELDFIDDLDEEPTTNRHLATAEPSSDTVGACDLLALLLSVESCPVSFGHERQMLSTISRIAVLGRGGKLPIYYAEAAANHMVGLLYVKFAPVWPGAVHALGALAKGHPELTWSPVLETVLLIMDRVPLLREQPPCRVNGESNCGHIDPNVHYDNCLAWDTPQEGVLQLFDGDVEACHEAGVVSRHESVDEETVLEWVWTVVENSPDLLTRHAVVVVPCILRFLQDQYLSGSRNDPDARELKIFDLVGCRSNDSTTSTMDKAAIHRRLIAVLKSLANVKNPRGLKAHGMVESIYLSLLTHSDNVVARLALICVLRFKDENLVPYENSFLKLLEKEQLRESLLHWKTLGDEGRIETRHRQKVLQILSRILFGRLSAKPAGKTSKHTPSSMRHAILSSLTAFCVDDDELYSFLYLCVRAYAPLDFDLKVIEQQDITGKSDFITALKNGSPESYLHVTSSVHMGFLHMLEALVAQLGHRISQFVPSFVTILVSILKIYEPKAVENHQLPVRSPGAEGREKSECRGGSIRALCYRRLSEIFAKYSAFVNFQPFQVRLWDSISESLGQLPASVVNATKAPAVLQLLTTMSMHTHLLHLISENDLAISSVIRCIEATSGASVIEAALSFVDNLLLHGADDDSQGMSVRPHVPLLLKQFRSRLNQFNPTTSPWTAKRSASSQPKELSTWRKELAILCRVSALIGDDESLMRDADGNALLSDLLVPFLSSGKLHDVDILNTLGILEAISSRLNNEAATDMFKRVSALLGPRRNRHVVMTKQIYRAMGSVLSALASTSFQAAAASAAVTLDLSAIHNVRIDEFDTDHVASVLGRLGGASGDYWVTLSKSETTNDPMVLQPIIATCFRFLFEADGVLSRGAFKALKALVSVAGRESQAEKGGAVAWLRLLEGSLIVFIRNGIAVKDEAIRRFYILLLAEIGRMSRKYGLDSPHLHSDLACLVRDNEPDLDFFLNITHVQIHRRAKAFQRLRQYIASDCESPDKAEPFFPQTISSILIPLATHVVYEARAKTDESLAAEAIATVGALCRLLPWSKYSSLLNTSLNQFHRHAEQERLLVGLICGILDGFHYQVTLEGEQGTGDESVVWRALEKRFIPKLESLLVKKGIDRRGEEVKTLRPPIVLAMLKLFQKFPRSYLLGQLPRLLSVICGMLKNRDSNVRDQARTTLANMTASLDIAFLADVVRELAVTLTEGYQLHVRSATLHSILLELSKSYAVPLAELACEAEYGFDGAVPAMMDLIQQDVFGDAQERKDAEGNNVRYVKEAAGSKSFHCLEIISSLISFRPLAQVIGDRSVVHVIVAPFLERLKEPTIGAGLIRRIKECLTRVVSGLSRNPSVRVDEVLAFVYATVYPFISDGAISTVSPHQNMEAESENEEDAKSKPLRVSGAINEGPVAARDRPHQNNVAEWRPSLSETVASATAARQARQRSERSLAAVEDGYSAPALTGIHRHVMVADTSALSKSNPASICAVVFGLHVLYFAVKKGRPQTTDTLASLDVFVPILTTCVCTCGDLEVVFLALKTLCLLLTFGLPSFEECSSSLSSKAIELLTSSGSASNQNGETTQSCFKVLAYLLNFERSIGLPKVDTVMKSRRPLDDAQMEVLVSFLRASIVQSDQYNPAFRLLKAIMSRRYTSSEFYDLMETLMEQTVRSSKPSLREQSANIFVEFLLTYPMSAERVEQHLKKAVLNINYEYTDGRLSALNMLSIIIKKLPQEPVEHHFQLFFLPLTVRLANDTSEECREAVANCIALLLGRLSSQAIQICYDYVLRWSNDGDPTLVRISLQLFGVFVDASPDCICKLGELDKMLRRIEDILQDCSMDWELSYFSLRALEKLYQVVRDTIAAASVLWLAVIRALSSSHPWVRRIACRLLAAYLTSIDLDDLGADKAEATLFVVKHPGSFETLARGLCRLVSLDDDEHNEELSVDIVKLLTWVLKASHHYPVLYVSEDPKRDVADQTSWLMKRLSASARNKGTKRRQTIYKSFASFAASCPEILEPHLELIIEPLHRSELETRNELELPHLVQNERPIDDAVTEESRLAKDVLLLLEQRFDSDDSFIAAYGAVKTKFQEKKDQRKQEMRTEAIVDPEASAKRKILKQDREKKRHKRRVDERRSQRGGTAKRRHVN